MSGPASADSSSKHIKTDKLRQDIERFYLPRQLVNAITEIGAIPDDSEEAIVGVGFLDIADYTFLSKFLSPNENQDCSQRPVFRVQLGIEQTRRLSEQNRGRQSDVSVRAVP